METLEDHVRALKKRLTFIILAFTAATAITFYYSQDILVWVQNDLNFTLNALHAYEAFYTQIMIAMLGGFLISLPFNVYQVLQFLKPGLRKKEYRTIRNFLPFSIILFLGGAAFAYNYVVKLSLAFFSRTTAAAGVEAIWGLQNTIGFALKLSAFTGIIFQLPIVALVLSRAGVIDSEIMEEYRAYFIVAILIVSAVATPPDIITQLLITGPVIGLYQLSIFLVRKFES
ncbi:MAG: twin-arginine translocase subunit TatC [Candidatus Nanohaloarchaea archaeon]